MADVEPLDALAKGPEELRVMVRRIGEEMQKDEAAMAALRRVGALPDKVVTVVAGAEGVLIGSGGETAEIDHDLAAHIFVHRL
jgi:DtxR family Mn-dependent transcriptional regulator